MNEEKLSAPAEPGTLAPSGTGALFVPLHAHRQVKIIPVTEEEFESLDDLGIQVQIFSNFGAAFLGLLLSGVWEAIKLPKGETLSPTNGGILVFLLLATVACALLAVMFFKRRKRRMQGIKDQTLGSST